MMALLLLEDFMVKLLSILFVFTLLSCNQLESAKEKNVLWVYTSLYKDTINDLTPRLKKQFPDLEVKWYQAGSEEIATKVNAEIMAENLQADVLISSDRFWYEELAQKGYLSPFNSPLTKEIDPQLRDPKGLYNTLSLPVMVLCYNNELIEKVNAPKTFKEMQSSLWKDKFTTGNPLASGTNFTTMAMLQYHYGWDYFIALKKNNTLSQGGNSSVLRRIQSKQRPIGWVLLENVLRFKDKDDRLEIIYPEDGVVTNNNIIAITKKSKSREMAQKFVGWMYGKEGQLAMTRSFMYSPLPSYSPPLGAPKLSVILKNSFPWSREFLQSVTANRTELKEKFTEIMFQ